MNRPFPLRRADNLVRSGRGLMEADAATEASPRSLRASDLPMLRPPSYSRHSTVQSGRTPTHRECRPYRPRPQPRWSPGRKHRRKQPLVNLALRLVALQAAPDLGPVRVNFRYNNTFSTSADFCEKSRRQQFCEEAHERAWARWAIVNPNCTDVQFQPVKAIFEDAGGKQHCSYWDVGLEFIDGSIIFGEIKPDETFFFKTRAAEMANASAKALRDHGIAFARLHGNDFDDITRATIKEVFDYRRTEFNPQADVEPVLEAIARGGNQISLRRAIELIGGHPSEAKAKLCAMMVKRYIALDLRHPLTEETIVQIAPSARNPGALRRFLGACEPLQEEKA